MVHSRLAIVFIVGVFQLCTASVIPDVTIQFSANELERAEKAGMSERSLVEGNRMGYTLEEMFKLNELKEIGVTSRKNVTFGYMTKVCGILDAEHKTSTSYTSAQETRLQSLIETMSYLDYVQAPFVRSTICAYISQPDLLDTEANSFGTQFIPYMDIRFLKMKAQTASGAERVKVTRQICCVYQNREEIPLSPQSVFSGLPDEDLDEFGKHWNAFETANTSKALEDVCAFLHTKKSNDDDECPIVVRVDA